MLYWDSHMYTSGWMLIIASGVHLFLVFPPRSGGLFFMSISYLLPVNTYADAPEPYIITPLCNLDRTLMPI